MLRRAGRERGSEEEDGALKGREKRVEDCDVM